MEASAIARQNVRNLWATVIWVAIEDLAGEAYGCPSAMEIKRAQKSAQVWFKSRSKRECSFEFCCFILDLDPAATRSRILSDPRSIIFPITTIGDAIRRYRERISISQVELARRLGTHPTTLSNVEVGTRSSRYKRPICTVVANKARELLKREAPDLIHAV